MLGFRRIQHSRMSSSRNAAEDMYGHTRTSPLLYPPTTFPYTTSASKICGKRAYANHMHNCRDRRKRSGTRLITTYHGCIQILLGPGRRSEATSLTEVSMTSLRVRRLCISGRRWMYLKDEERLGLIGVLGVSAAPYDTYLLHGGAACKTKH